MRVTLDLFLGLGLGLGVMIRVGVGVTCRIEHVVVSVVPRRAIVVVCGAGEVNAKFKPGTEHCNYHPQLGPTPWQRCP